MNELADDVLMGRLAEGDASALEPLVGRWQGPVRRFLRRMLGDTEEAEDLAQETFLRIFQSAAGYRPEGRFRSWLFRIAGNLARNEIRRRRLRRILSLEALAERVFPTAGGEGGASGADHILPRAEDDPARDLEASRRRAALQAALLTLPARQRQAMILRHWEGLRQRETAEILGVSEAAVEGLLWRASVALRRKLGGMV
jgi:RNA polymerase sigma-70 factor (ECF subfamily)